MDELKAVAEYVRSVAPLVGDPQDIEGYEADSADVTIARMHSVSVPDEAMRRLVGMLESIPKLRELQGGIAHGSPCSSGSISLDSIAQWLLAQARFSHPDDCVQGLMAVIAKNESPLMEIVPIWGISPRVNIDIGEGLKVVPIRALPPSKLRDLFIGKRRHKFSFDIANSSPRPGAAIIKETVHGPLYEPSMCSTSRREKTAAAERTSIYNEAEELGTVISLCASGPIFPLAQWYQRPIDLPLVGKVATYSGPINDHPFCGLIEQQDYPVAEIEALVRRYRALDDQTRRRLRTPLSRLNQGRREHAQGSVENATIDLGIAAEALLTYDRERDAPISFMVRARGTLLLGGSPDERRRNYESLKALYDLRSKAAHEGSIADLRNIRHSERDRSRLNEASKTVASGEVVCKVLIRKVIEAGGFPVWDRLMFGW